MTPSPLERYQASWRRFVADLAVVYGDLADVAADSGSGSLHELLRQLHWEPYTRVKELVASPKVDTTSLNVGTVTGLFFEQAALSIIVPYIRRRLPTAEFERGICSDTRVRSIARDPDLYVQHGDNAMVFEIKLSPKKRDIEYVWELHDRHAEAGVSYVLIAGELSVGPTIFDRLAEQDWACFMSASERNASRLAKLPTLDAILHEAVATLAGA